MSGAIKEAIQELAGTKKMDGISIVIASVVSVDFETRTCICTAINGDVELSNVMLSAEPNDGVIITPTVGSTVLVGYSVRNQPFILMFSEIDAIETIVNNTKFKIEDGKTTFNNGSFGGLIKIGQLVSYLQQLDAWTFALKAVIDVGSYPSPGLGLPDPFHAALKAAIDPLGSTSISRPAIEDTTIVH